MQEEEVVEEEVVVVEEEVVVVVVEEEEGVMEDYGRYSAVAVILNATDVTQVVSVAV